MLAHFGYGRLPVSIDVDPVDVVPESNVKEDGRPLTFSAMENGSYMRVTSFEN